MIGDRCRPVVIVLAVAARARQAVDANALAVEAAVDVVGERDLGLDHPVLLAGSVGAQQGRAPELVLLLPAQQLPCVPVFAAASDRSGQPVVMVAGGCTVGRVRAEQNRGISQGNPAATSLWLTPTPKHLLFVKDTGTRLL